MECNWFAPPLKDGTMPQHDPAMHRCATDHLLCPFRCTIRSRPGVIKRAVRIPGLGTFVVVRERVVSKEKDLVVVERPVFHLANAIARDHDLRYGCIDVPGHQHFEQLPYAQIASDNAVSEGTVQLCVERTMRLFRVCLENRDNVALVWRDVGMLIIQGRDVKMRFYTDFLKRLNGTDQMLQAVLEMPEMRDSVISRHDTAASQTSSGRVIVLPGYKLETVPKMPTVKADLTGHVKAAPEKGWGKGDGSGKKEDLAEQRLLRRARLSPKRLPAATVKSEQGQKAEGSEPRARQLLAIQGSSLKEKEEKEKQKLIPLVEPRTVDFIARAIERREKNKHLKRKEKLPEHIQKYLDEEEEEKTELAEEKKRKLQTPPVTKEKAKREKETLKAKAEREKETQRSQESSSSEQASVSPSTSTETGDSSPDLLETMTEEWEEAGEEAPTVCEDDAVPPKRSLSPRTRQALRQVVTCILGQVTRKRRGQRDDQADLQDKLKCELAVLQWRRLGQEACSSPQLREAGPQPAPPARAGKRRAGPAQPRACTEEEGRKLWDSLRKKCQQKARAKVAPPKAWKDKREQWEAQVLQAVKNNEEKSIPVLRGAKGSCVRGTPEWWGEGRKGPSAEDEESPEDKPSLCLLESSPLKSPAEQIWWTSASARRASRAQRLPREMSSESLLQHDERQCRPARLLTPVLPSVQ
ncbi:caldesmon-like isoform X2 [Aquila chrysaetos chrysaetos]|uniref:caldesmon-like isoform X2 n=1 Tax=Aquila chrysaetos chrysaetos TaxID=223781 RepID=UPI001B7D3157|nr:caldesmon-like isoform X2 [Aquila chrysaetos chrysaetos]